MNAVQLTGRLTAEPEAKVTPNGNHVTTFRLAVKRPKTKDKTDFVTCVAWRNTADFITTYAHKGQKIGVTGMLTTRTWENNGVTHYATEIVVDEVEFCEKKEGSGTSNKAESGASWQATAAEQTTAEAFTSLEDGELPF